MEDTVYQYLRKLNVPVSKKYLAKQIASHPDYPSLLSISDILKQLDIPHGVARVDRENLKELTFPYILHLEKNGGEFIIIKEERDLNKQPDLQNDWNGVVLKAETPEEMEDEENREYLAKEKTTRRAAGLFLFSVMVMVAGLGFQNFSLINALLMVTTIVGAVSGYLLAAKDFGVKYDTVESFCNAGKKSSCDRVLQSDEAALIGQFSFSDAVLSYFAAQLTVAGLLVPLAESTASLWWALAAAGVLTLPVVIYSLWLQGVKFKTWCRLCLLVAVVLVVQAGLFGWMAAAGGFGLADGSPWGAGLVAGLFLSAGSFVFLIKTQLKEGNEAEQSETAANRVKYSPSVFAHLLLQQPQVDCTPFEQELLIGKPDTPVQITMAASLGCGPCKDGFEKAKQLVRRYPDKVNFSVRFSLPQHKNGIQTDPGRYILGYWLRKIYATKHPSENTENLLQDWFELADWNQFREQYSLQANGQDSELETLAAQHTAWFEKTNVKGTPTFFVNSFNLPGQYRVEDLRYLNIGFSNQNP
ncbi:MAG: vitamin K epoxide reductase family protein, partial [Balneolaceae bacterium]